ncbi:4Fe-4S binding protein [Sporosalibacterium faouarense]|uniref:4Fe-4S binding protein n=1 Tax=Sporosalibacterium faouarense TaxID=516123 RepID=UPI00141C44D8|nr:4Fe-4S binding protein [Sporosalibacterium faouarense]MTI49482.1 4Fe-4S dicluster domain-containing protein [Bacillota bacterium]
MKKAIINETRCDQSPFCPVVKSCPVNAIKQEKLGFFKAKTPKVDHDICIGCEKCVRYCPHGAVNIINK